MDVILKADDVKSQALDHLGLVASVINRLKLVEKINTRITASEAKGSKISMGHRVAAMILNGLGFTDDRLYLFSDFLKNKPVKRLISESLSAEDFTDDALGRCLDAISEYGVTPFFSEIAFEIGLSENLLGHSAHFDTTSLTVYGEFEDQPAATDVKTKNTQTDETVTPTPLIVAHGHSKAHRPDLKQVILNLATTGAGFPIWMEPHSGNASDKKILHAGANRMHEFCKQLKNSPVFLYVGDSAFYERCVKEKALFKWLSRVPERLNAAKTWVETPDESLTWTILDKGYKMTPLSGAGYGDVAQRWIMIHSEKAAVRENATLQRNIQKELDAYTKVLWHLGNQVFKCEHDAEEAGLRVIKAMKYHRVASWSTEPIIKHEGRGRPKKDATPVSQGVRLVGMLEQDTARIELIKRRKGRFILGSNELDPLKLADSAFLSEYKEQYKTEQEFAFIKGNTFEVSSIFLKKPSRIEALMMVMTLSLMVYGVAQHNLRQALEQTNETIPNQIKKPTKNPSMAWVFRLFQGIHIWFVPYKDKVQELVVNLTEVTRRIIHYFGPSAERIYASSS